VKDRFYRETGLDFDVRAFCAKHGTSYQAYRMLRNNPEVLKSKVQESKLLARVADKPHLEKELAFYVLILGLGDIRVLDGTKLERVLSDQTPRLLATTRCWASYSWILTRSASSLRNWLTEPCGSLWLPVQAT
jgi:hypothetical protein